MKALRFGVKSYLIKPTSAEAILGKARELLGASFP